MDWAGATKRGFERFYAMARKPEEKPEGERAARREAPKARNEIAAPASSRGAKGPHCGDMGLASREQQFRPGSGGR
jgi:hypothetical protein